MIFRLAVGNVEASCVITKPHRSKALGFATAPFPNMKNRPSSLTKSANLSGSKAGLNNVAQISRLNQPLNKLNNIMPECTYQSTS